MIKLNLKDKSMEEVTNRVLTLKNATSGKYEFVAQTGIIVTDRVGRQIGFRAVRTSPNLKTEGEAVKWLNRPPLN